MSPFGLTSLKADQPVMSAFHDEGGSFESALCRLYTWYSPESTTRESQLVDHLHPLPEIRYE